jgi:hypothetical protein
MCSDCVCSFTHDHSGSKEKTEESLYLLTGEIFGNVIMYYALAHSE